MKFNVVAAAGYMLAYLWLQFPAKPMTDKEAVLAMACWVLMILHCGIAQAVSDIKERK